MEADRRHARAVGCELRGGTIRLPCNRPMPGGRCRRGRREAMSVSDDVVAKFTQLATPTLANALDDVGFEGVLSGLAQMVPGTRCVGRAVTVREITGRRGDFTSDDFKVGKII